MWLCPIRFETAHFPPKRLARFLCTALKPLLMILTGVVNARLVRSAQIIFVQSLQSASFHYNLFYVIVYISLI
jgi:hypothetical protein